MAVVLSGEDSPSAAVGPTSTVRPASTSSSVRTPNLFTPAPPTVVARAATTEELSASLLDSLARIYDGTSRMTGAFSRENCGSPCAIDFDFTRNAEGTSAKCFRDIEPASLRAAPNYDASQHEPLLSALDQACRLVYQIDGESEKDRALAQAAFDVLDPLVPEAWKH